MKKKHIKISEMTGKLEGLVGINTDPLCNPFCAKSCPLGKSGRCYSRAMLAGFRKSARPRFARNGELLSEGIIEESKIPRIYHQLVRLQAHGELINRTHARNLMRIAGYNPRVTFGFWTRRPRLVQGLAVPDNVVMIYSAAPDRLITKPPTGFHKVFNTLSKERSGVEFNCTGRKCWDCRKCYDRKTEPVIVEKLRRV